jgi:hypothetical protein
VLKEALEVSKIKEMIIGTVMLEQNKDRLAKIADAIRKILDPGRPGDTEGPPAEQGNT